MRKLSYVLAAMAMVSLAAPAVAQDKPMAKEGMEKPMVHHHHMHVHHVHHHHHHHMMAKPMMEKKM
jgi:hypothetical protein